jgi:hypothetical protein
MVWANREVYLGVGRIAVLGAMILISADWIRNSMDLIVILPVLALYSLSYLAVLGAGPPSGTALPRVPRDPVAGDPS